MKITFSLKTDNQDKFNTVVENGLREHFLEAMKSISSLAQSPSGSISINDLSLHELSADRGEFLSVMDQQFDVSVDAGGKDSLRVTIYPKPDAPYVAARP